jgi:hypothetical protein
MDSETKSKPRDDRDFIIRFDDAQIKEVLVKVDRKEGAPIVYANISKFSRLGVDFILDLVQIDPAEFHLLIQGARNDPEIPSTLEMNGTVVARVLMGPVMVRNVKDQAETILEGVEVKQPKPKGESPAIAEAAAVKVITHES